MKVAIYCRVSTDDKDQDPERQVMKCKQYCELHNHEVIETITEYHTGDSDPFSRPEGKKLLELDIEGIIIFSMDRLTRQHPVKVIHMINRLKDVNIKIISITEPAFNMESDFSEMIIYIMTWFNNYFLKKLKRDIKSGMERAKRDGKQIGRPNAKFNKYRAHQLLFNDSKSQRDVAKELNTSVSTINRFKRLYEKNPDSFINEELKPKGSVIETVNEVK